MEITQGKQRFIDWDTLNKDSVQFVTAMLVGNNFCLVVYGLFAGKVILEYLHFDWIVSNPLILLLAQMLISTPIIILIAEFLPKLLGYRYNMYTLSILMPIASLIYRLFKFMGGNAITSWCSSFIFSQAKKSKYTGHIQKSKNQKKKKLQDIFRLEGEEIDQSNYLGMLMRMSENALGFDQLRVRNCMISSMNIKSFAINGSLEDLRAKFVETGFSRILIYENAMDTFIGYVHAFDMIKQEPKDIRAILIDIPKVFESMSIKEALRELTKSHKSLALVMDEYGNTSGLVSVEDMIEQIFGDIKDEHDKVSKEGNSSGIQELSKGKKYVVEARVKIEVLNEFAGLGLPISHEYETLAGFILNSTQDIPSVGDHLVLGEFHIEILEATRSAIRKVLLKKK